MDIGRKGANHDFMYSSGKWQDSASWFLCIMKDNILHGFNSSAFLVAMCNIISTVGKLYAILGKKTTRTKSCLGHSIKERKLKL